MHIINSISIPGCLPHYGFSHRFELNTNLSNMSDKDKRLLYNLIIRLIFLREITVPDVHAYVLFIISRMELLTFCHKNSRLQVNVLSVKKLWLFSLSSTEKHYIHVKLLFSKHTKYLLNICQQIIQSQRFNKASIKLKRVLKNVTHWFNGDQHFILTKYTTDIKNTPT